MTNETDCTLFMTEDKAVAAEQREHITVAHFPPIYIKTLAWFGALIISSICGVYGYMYYVVQVSAAHDERIGAIEEYNAHTDDRFHSTDRFDLLKFNQNAEPILMQVATNKTEIKNIKDQFYAQNKDIQSMLTQIVGDIGEIKGQLKGDGK